MTFWWENYNYASCCIWLWNLAFFVDGRTEAEVIRERGDEEDILIQYGESDRRPKKFA